MLLTTNGVVIRERPIGENDKYVDVLTRDCGLLEVMVRGARKQNSKNGASTQLFMYSRLCINHDKGRYILNSSEPINSFYNIRLDVKKLALASYFSDVLQFTILPDEPCDVVTRLLLNTLYYLNNDERDFRLLKPIFEMRLMSEIGLIPRLIGCCECCAYEAEVMYFDMENGKLICNNCYDNTQELNVVALSPTMLYTIRYIALSDYNKVFHFTLSESAMNELSYICEKYVLIQLKRSFRTLEFYKSMLE